MPRSYTSCCVLVLSLVSVNAFTNSKSAHVPDTEEEHTNLDLVGYTATKDTPNFHFRRIGTTSAATEFAQVSVDFNLQSITTHILSLIHI